MKINLKNKPKKMEFQDLGLGEVFEAPFVEEDSIMLKISNDAVHNAVDLKTMDLMDMVIDDVVCPYPNATLTLE